MISQPLYGAHLLHVALLPAPAVIQAPQPPLFSFFEDKYIHCNNHFFVQCDIYSYVQCKDSGNLHGGLHECWPGERAERTALGECVIYPENFACFPDVLVVKFAPCPP